MSDKLPSVAEVVGVLNSIIRGGGLSDEQDEILAAAISHLERMEKENDGMLNVLKSVEWQLPRERPDDRSGAIYAACPECAGFMGDGHFDGCKLAAALAVKEGDAK